MADKPNNPFQFWQELKRRKVFRVIAMYVAAAYVIIELSNNVVEPLSLPAWTPTMIIVLLVIGFPFAVIFSWIFDITPEGVKKTESIETVKEQEPLLIPVKRKQRVSDVIIAVLVVVVVILAYPKIFKKDKFEDIRDSAGRISVAVMPFQNLTNDTLNNVWETGIQNLLISSLSNSEEELSVRQSQTMFDIFESTGHTNYASITPSIASDIAIKLEANTFIHGSLYKDGNKIRINAQLRDSETEEINKSFEIDGNTKDDMFHIIDSLSYLIKDYLEIKVLGQEIDYDVSTWANTNSPEAYRFFIRGVDRYWSVDYVSAIDLFTEASKIDSSFLSNTTYLMLSYLGSGQYKKSNQLLNKIYRHVNDLPYFEQLQVKYWKANLSDKNIQEAIKYLGLILEHDPQQRMFWYRMGLQYNRISRYGKAAEAYEKALEIDRQWGGGWKWSSLYWGLGKTYHEVGNHKREKEIYELGLSILPDNPGIIFNQAICALSLGDTVNANEYIRKYRSIRETEGWEDYWIEYRIGQIYYYAKQFDTAINIYRDLIAKDSQEPWSKLSLGHILINNDINVNEGMEFIEQALEIEPNDLDLLYSKGMGLYKQGHLDEALEFLNKSWDLRPIYHHDQYLLMKEVEQALANQIK